MLSKFFYAIGVLALIVLALNTIGSIVYFIYLWGGQGLPFAASAWQATLTWLTIGVTAFITFVITLLLSVITEK